MSHWSTETVPARERFSYWADAICDAFLEMQISSETRSHFAGKIEQCQVGPLGLNFVTSIDQQVCRTRHAISRSRENFFYLLQCRGAPMTATQRNRAVVLGDGDYVLIDSKEPYRFEISAPHGCLSIAIPAAYLRYRLVAPEDGVAVSLSRRNGWGEILGTALSNLTPASVCEWPLSHDVFAELLGTLLSLTLAPRQAGTPSQNSLRCRMHERMRESFHDCALAPATLAGTVGVSKRYLHKLYAADSTSFGAELMALRLDAAKRLLEDCSFARTPIGNIAYRCGFADPSHFARVFRLRFGQTPGAHRRAVRY